MNELITTDKFHQTLDGPVAYKDGILHVDGVNILDIEKEIGSPFYVYSHKSMATAYRKLETALAPLAVSICFAVKANSNLSVLRLLGSLGAGMDIVSAGELERSLAAGVKADRIVFSGVGKKRSEIARALHAGVHQLNIESAAELDAVIDVAQALGVRAPVALRVNPDVDARTHAKISTGRKGDKFGIAYDEVPDLFAKAHAAPEIEAVGLAVHIGSQLLDLTPYRAAYTRLSSLIIALRARGLPVERLDLGGGLGISYDGEPGVDLDHYAAIIADTVSHLDCALTVEPGRWLVGPAGMLVSQVIYPKRSGDVRMLIIDAAMNDLMRPALYEARHSVMAVKQGNPEAETYQIVGPVCESSDIFGSFTGLPKLNEGDLLAFTDAGAYGASMASTYNTRELVPEVLAQDSSFSIVRRRQSVADMMNLEINEI